MLINTGTFNAKITDSDNHTSEHPYVIFTFVNKDEEVSLTINNCSEKRALAMSNQTKSILYINNTYEASVFLKNTADLSSE